MRRQERSPQRTLRSEFACQAAQQDKANSEGGPPGHEAESRPGPYHTNQTGSPAVLSQRKIRQKQEAQRGSRDECDDEELAPIFWVYYLGSVYWIWFTLTRAITSTPYILATWSMFSKPPLARR
jgi:hypothetical protein